MPSAAERRDALKAVYREARECVRCPLHQTRTQVVFGNGSANA
ncbi:MAG: uracil-DNA glycosylase, partial [Actinobacteria bacterium]